MIEALKNIGFVVTERLERKELSSDLQNRYSELPADYQEFLQRLHIPEHTRSLSGSLLGYKTIP